jgi:hypothetical protein
MNIVRIIGTLSLIMVGATIGLTSTSCSSGGDKPQPPPYDDPCDYVGDEDGSNWKGDKSDGMFQLGIKYENGHVVIGDIGPSYTVINVPKKNLVIPKYIRKSDGDSQILSVETFQSQSFYSKDLVGSLFIPNTLEEVSNRTFSFRNENFNKIIFNYSSIDELQYGDESFVIMEYSSGTIKNCDPNLTSQGLVNFLWTKGLPHS